MVRCPRCVNFNLCGALVKGRPFYYCHRCGRFYARPELSSLTLWGAMTH